MKLPKVVPIISGLFVLPFALLLDYHGFLFVWGIFKNPASRYSDFSNVENSHLLLFVLAWAFIAYSLSRLSYKLLSANDEMPFLDNISLFLVGLVLVISSIAFTLFNHTHTFGVQDSFEFISSAISGVGLMIYATYKFGFR